MPTLDSLPPEIELAAELPDQGPMNQRRVLGLSLPIIGENMLQTLVGAVDTLLVAKLGSEAVAGVGTAVEFVYFIISILIALEIGATVLVSQAFGANLPAARPRCGAASTGLGSIALDSSVDSDVRIRSFVDWVVRYRCRGCEIRDSISADHRRVQRIPAPDIRRRRHLPGRRR